MADVGIVIVPDLDQLVGIAAGAVQVAKALCLGDEGRPRVAMLSSVDTVNPAIPGNANAALIVQMAARGQIPGRAKLDPARSSTDRWPLTTLSALTPRVTRASFRTLRAERMC